jgi:hypothetical protein
MRAATIEIAMADNWVVAAATKDQKVPEAKRARIELAGRQRCSFAFALIQWVRGIECLEIEAQYDWRASRVGLG